MSVSTATTPTVVIPSQFFAPSVPSTQAVALALIAAPVASSQVTQAAVAMPAGQAAQGLARSAHQVDSAGPHGAAVNLMAGTSGQNPTLGRHVDMYL